MPGPNVGFATLSIIPSARGIGKTLDDEIDGPLRDAGKTGGGNFLGSFKGAIKLGGLAAGAAAGALILKGFDEAIGQGASSDKLAARLGLNETESARFGGIAGDLYADAFGDSFEQVNEALGTTASIFGRLASEDLERLTAKGLNLAETFDLDVNDAIGRAGILLTEGLAKDADEAFDLVVSAMQRVPPAIRDELGEATTEYGKFFRDLGLDGEEMFALFAAQDDKFSLDKAGDAIKEFTIRSTDMSALTKTAFETMGLDAETMAGRILEGGDTARGAFDEIITGLLSIEDPVARSNTAIALFGTPLEDLGVNKIPAFLTSLDNLEGGMGDVEGAAVRMGDTLNDNAATKIETFKRQALQGLTDFLGDTVIPEIEDLSDAWGDDGFSGVLDLLINEKFPEWLENFNEWMREEGVPAFYEAGKDLGAAILRGFRDFFTSADSLLGPAAGAKFRVPGTDFEIRLPGGRAHGGPVWPGTWLVGEQGPELLTLGQGMSGFVTPNHQLDSVTRVGEGQTFIQNIYNPAPEPAASSARALRRVALELR